MHKISVDTEGVAAYGATADGLAGEMAAAAAGAAGANPVLLGPIFGLVGGDFVAAYAAAHAGHVAAIGELSAVLGTVGAAVTSAAGSYTATDAAGAAGVRAAEGDLP
ncbi:type VII secretion target [Nocardia sp. CDC159]|uniref:Type VII secretion target n=1 Tax=Nocardia pulmonis TaxID=2951408 RepID=A0A9X2J159_9NOCA|nr:MULTISPECIES: type VII secretion target [Nocardia]MCM6777760.1 type VII secretion target [Nocardia pulmonis]MCM6790645.1 type VII secretion target [Nocardia sp. CDC159]